MKNVCITITKRLCLFVIVFCYNKKILAQYNLVNNGSFEDYVICPASIYTPPPKNWYMPTNYTGFDYANACSNPSNWGVPYNTGNENYQYARTGMGYINMLFLNFPPYNNLREYYQSKLKYSLKQTKYYYIEFFVSNSNATKLKCNNISALLSKTAVRVDTVATPFGVLHANAQIVNYGNPIINDTLNWVKVSSIYKAQGGEQYLTLGNFKDDTATQYYASQPTGYNGAAIMIDDVSVIPLDSFCLKADAGRDTTIKAGDSVFIGSYTNGIDTIRWLNGATVIDSAKPGFWVKPTVTTTYILHQIVNGCYSSDTVTVNVTIVPLTITNYELRMTNVGGGSPPLEGLGVVNKWQTMNEVNVSHYNVQRSTNGKDFITVGKVKANNKVLNEYRYTDDRLPLTVDGQLYYRIVGVDNDGKMTYSEVKRVAKTDKSNISVEVYPNPSNGVVNVKLPLLSKGNFMLKVVDVYGKIIISKIISEGSINEQINLNTKGIYFINLVNTTTGKQLFQKIIIQ